MSRYISEMTVPKFAEAIASGTPVILTIGALEEHGSHLPVSTDDAGVANQHWGP